MTHRRMRGKDVIFLETFSADAAKEVADDSLDFVYIDGMHLYDFVMMDIILWSKKVREGGILSGHDYTKHRDLVEVVRVVNDYVREHRINPLYITDSAAAITAGDKGSSWFFINPGKRKITGRVKKCGRY